MGSSTRFGFLFFSFLLLSTVFASAQERQSSFNKQFSFSHENDLFAFRGTDGYYTSGLFINYSVAKNNNKPGVIKTIDNIEVGQKIYTAGIRQVLVITQLDRPITGYLYTEFSRTRFKANNSFIRIGISTGTVGSMALGKELLEVIHPLLKIDAKAWSWVFDYGIKNEVGVNAHGSFGFSVFPENYARLLQLTPVSNATLGTSFTNVRQSVLVQLGRQNAMHQSGFWNSRVQSNSGNSPIYKKEVFVFYQPELMYQLYNATIQGGMFRSDKGRVISKSQTFVLTNKLGAMYATPRLSLGIHLTFQSKEAKSQETSHVFGGVSFAYRYK